jgi:hypothetical protein
VFHEVKDLVGLRKAVTAEIAAAEAAKVEMAADKLHKLSHVDSKLSNLASLPGSNSINSINSMVARPSSTRLGRLVVDI